MSMTGLDVFDNTVQKSNRWLKEIMEELGWGNRHRAYHALRATLHALRDHLSIEEVVQLAAQLPMLIRGIYYEGWQLNKIKGKERCKKEFLDNVLHYFEIDPDIDPEYITRAVFRVLCKRISEGEVEDIISILPKELKELWPQPTHV